MNYLQLVLDFLALRHDINYWKTRTDLSGVSGRSVLWRAFSQSVVFLYLLDEKTSLLVLVPSGLNTLLEVQNFKVIFCLDIVRSLLFLILLFIFKF